MERYEVGPQVAGPVYRGGVTATELHDEGDRAWVGDWADGAVVGVDIAAAGGGRTRIEIFLTLEDVRQVLLMAVDSRDLALEQIDHIKGAAYAIANRDALLEMSGKGLHAIPADESE